ncbi:MvdC/MvdD family ATP grasp protein [Micromonospora sp. DT229]|uniref:MvdC/MvdD family ATP grasp protein n=1 Tax=Micromonospora sp. DT229 TaxID=3393430 RepID=UPI003CF37A61
MILIISSPDDAVTIDLVRLKMEARGVPVLWWDEDQYPAHSRLTAAIDGDGCRQILKHDGQTYDLAEVTAVWDRRPSPIQVNDLVTEEDYRAYAELVARRFRDGFWELLPARWMPAQPIRALRSDNKLVHLAKAAELGFTVPQTLFTNDPDELIPAWNRAGGQLISKALTYRDFFVYGEQHLIYTTKVQRRHLAGRHRIQHAPVILQPDVAKAAELRVTVVGDQIFAAEIDSQSSRLTAQDWRRYDDNTVEYRAVELPDEVAKRCLDFISALGLNFGAIDLIRSTEGDYVFLEVNVNGQWGWIEKLTGLPISDAITDWLTANEPVTKETAL